MSDDAVGLDGSSEGSATDQGRLSFGGREWLSYTPGSTWILDGVEVVIDRITAVDRLLVCRRSTGEVLEIERHHLVPLADTSPASCSIEQLEKADTEEIVSAKAKEAALEPYMDGRPLRKKEREELAKRFQVDVSTIKRWAARYRELRHWSAFLDRKAGWPSGMSKLLPAVEAIITAAIDAQSSVDQDFTAETLLPTIRDRCIAAKFPPPSLGAVRRRVNRHREQVENMPSDAREEQRRRVRLKRGQFELEMALSVVQVDHTPIDMPVHCPVTGRSLGCPVITIVFDVKTRVVLGFCLSLEAASQLSTALALHHAVFPKDAWLERVGATGPWPFYGIMRVLHTDNASEFVSPHLKRAAHRWNINPITRGKVQDGGHIERFLGTLNRRIHGQVGASRYRGKRRRNAPKGHHTLASATTWIANEITAYHHEIHRKLAMSPAQAWEEAWMSSDGMRLPVIPRDEREFLVSFLPGASRVVSREGILWKGLQYRCPDLEPFICSEKRQFFRFDKRDISRIFFETGDGFLEVPWAQWNYPTLSLWEWDELRPQLRSRIRNADMQTVHHAREANRMLNQRLQGSSQRARRRIAREAEWQQPLPTAAVLPVPSLAASIISEDSVIPFEILE